MEKKKLNHQIEVNLINILVTCSSLSRKISTSSNHIFLSIFVFQINVVEIYFIPWLRNRI